MDGEGLRRFLIAANMAGYASDAPAAMAKEKDGSTTITHVSRGWRFHDNYFGGEPYGGRTVVFHEGRPVFLMVYYGHVAESMADVKGVYTFLRKALRRPPEAMPVRGPREFKEGDFEYRNAARGDLSGFAGEEVILLRSEAVYSASYLGGLVNRRAG